MGMNQEFKNVLRATPAASLELKHQILTAIAAREARHAKVRTWTISTIGILATLGIIPAIIQLGNQISQSGSFQYLSIAFSGGLGSAWRDIILAFVESLPITTLIIFFAIVTVALWSARIAFKNYRQRFIEIS